ncbi:hypothetical protein QUV83_04925 [Cellulomonas cellasea]|uniref:hypothetical protein n=1 Tax=Cellulomonas cellasea TaxID=43670 RepID=UPI0025A43E56|nr:hypothetical protein [Cellulomonas cellasea]MDM8084105.1 hypothetical protein [Cellulomonas cellasea]
MTDTTDTSADDAPLAAISRAVAAADQAESDLEDAVEAAQAAGVPPAAISRVLATRGSALRSAVQALVAALGPTYVAALAKAASKDQVIGWADAHGAAPGPDAALRLRLAHRTWERVADAQGEDAARAWFLGANPRLGGDSPLVAIKKDRANEVRSAVDALLDGR